MSDDSAKVPVPSLLLKALYWLSTGYMLFLMGFSVVMYHANNAAISDYFLAVGYPSYLVYPLAYAKLLAIFIVVSHRYNDLRDMAYAAYFVNMVLAFAAHIEHGDAYQHAAAGGVAVIVSYLLGNRVRGKPSRDFFARFTL